MYALTDIMIQNTIICNIRTSFMIVDLIALHSLNYFSCLPPCAKVCCVWFGITSLSRHILCLCSHH